MRGESADFVSAYLLGSLDEQGLSSLALEQGVVITNADGTLSADGWSSAAPWTASAWCFPTG